MTIKLAVCPEFESDWTGVILEGEAESAVMNVLVSRLAACGYEVLIENGEGELIPFEDYEPCYEEEDDDER